MLGRKAEKTFAVLNAALTAQHQNENQFFTRRSIDCDVSYVTQTNIIEQAIVEGLIQKLDHGIYKITPHGEHVIERINLLQKAIKEKQS